MIDSPAFVARKISLVKTVNKTKLSAVWLSLGLGRVWSKQDEKLVYAQYDAFLGEIFLEGAKICSLGGKYFYYLLFGGRAIFHFILAD